MFIVLGCLAIGLPGIMHQGDGIARKGYPERERARAGTVFSGAH